MHYECLVKKKLLLGVNFRRFQQLYPCIDDVWKHPLYREKYSKKKIIIIIHPLPADLLVSSISRGGFWPTTTQYTYYIIFNLFTMVQTTRLLYKRKTTKKIIFCYVYWVLFVCRENIFWHNPRKKKRSINILWTAFPYTLW